MVERIVIDNSALVPLFMPHESSAFPEHILRLAGEGANLMSPSFLAIEFGNAMLSGFRAGKLSVAQVSFAHSKLHELPIELVDFVGPRTIPSIHSLAVQHGLSFYDALYLALAMEEGAALAANDKALNKAASAVGIRTLNQAAS